MYKGNIHELSKRDQVDNLLLIECTFSLKTKKKIHKEKGAYGLSPGWKIVCIQVLPIIC